MSNSNHDFRLLPGDFDELEPGNIVLSRETLDYIRAVEGIESWIYNHPNADTLNLVIGPWDVSENTWMATLQDNSTGEICLVAGESSYGSETAMAAVVALWGELQLMNHFAAGGK